MRTTLGGMVALGVLAASAAGLATGCGASSDAVVIGVTGPFAQPRGESMRLAAELARDEINRAGGVGGRRLELRFLDDSADTDVAVRVAMALHADPAVVAVVGHLTSGATLAAAPIYNGGPEPLLAITPSASSPEVTGAGASIFRACPTDLAHGDGLGRYAWETLGARRVAVLFHNDEYGRGVRRSFAERYRALGGTIVAEDPYLPQTATVSPYLLRLVRQGGADAIMIAGARAEAERILAVMDSLGIRLPVLGADALAGIAPPRGHAAPIFLSNAYVVSAPGARNEAFITAYRQASDGRLPDHRGATTYDILHLLARAIGDVGADRARLHEYLAGVGTASAPYDGVTGTIAFDGNGDVFERNVVVLPVEAERTP